VHDLLSTSMITPDPQSKFSKLRIPFLNHRLDRLQIYAKEFLFFIQYLIYSGFQSQFTLYIDFTHIAASNSY